MRGIAGWLRGMRAGGQHTARADDERVLSSEQRAELERAGGGCEFALAMLRSLDWPPGNLVFSPFSIRTVLSMARAGARNETAAQLSALLGVSPENESADIRLAAMVQRHGPGGRTGRLSVVNSLWCQDGEALQAGFADLIERQYSGAVSLVDFRGAVEHARATINRWVEARTAQVIGELIPAHTLDAQTRFVLVNAICFTGIWELRFPRTKTCEEPFFLESGRTVQAPLMYQKAVAWYARGPGYQAVDLAYEGHGLSMLVIVPDRKDGLRDLEQGTFARMFGVAWGLMSLCQVELFLPRFAIAWGTVDLRRPLVNLGLTHPFDPSKADFSGINGRQPPSEEALFVSAVLHKAYVEVNEEGTEAAAATAAPMSLIGSAGPLPPPQVPVVRADHPFLFAIRERRSGGILFLGRVVDPTHRG